MQAQKITQKTEARIAVGIQRDKADLDGSPKQQQQCVFLLWWVFHGSVPTATDE